MDLEANYEFPLLMLLSQQSINERTETARLVVLYYIITSAADGNVILCMGTQQTVSPAGSGRWRRRLRDSEERAAEDDGHGEHHEDGQQDGQSPAIIGPVQLGPERTGNNERVSRQ